MIVRELGLREYREVWDEMIRFNKARDDETEDEIWLLQHYPVYTQGTSCHDKPSLLGQHIPVVHTDRGGQITYHGPGQLIAYLLVNIKRLNSGPKTFVNMLESCVIDLLQGYGISGRRKEKAPGVYVEEKKIAALGIRISRGCTYHGLSLNVSMDLTPFHYINPCGYEGLEVTQISDYTAQSDFETVSNDLKVALKNWL